MKSEWKVTSNPIGGQTMYAAFRIKDISQPDHSGNREYAGEYISNREAVEFVVEELNKGESTND